MAPDAPAFSVDEGNYYADQSLSLTSATEGASIYYTLDGSTPTSASTLYCSAIAITSPTTVKAIAIKNGLSSAVVSKKIGVYKPENEYTSNFTFGSSLGLNDGATVTNVGDNAATITFSKGTANTNPRWNASGNSVTFVAGNNITVTPSLTDGVITSLTLHYADGTSQTCNSLPAMTSKMDVNVGNLTSIDLEYRVPKQVANNLAEIIDNGVRGECYKINSTTYGIYQTGNLLYAKDLNGFTNKSVLPEPYTWNSHDDSPAQFDQSNWLVLKINDGLDYSKKDIEGGLIGQLNAGSETPQLDVANTISATNNSDAYVPNTYRIYNCLGNAGNFFVEPKVNEYARVKWALVMESGGVRYIHEMDKDLEHKIKIDESLYTDQTNKIITGEAYLLEGIMGTQTKASGAAEFSSSRIKANIPSTKEWVIYPTKIVKITTGTDETDIAQNTAKIFGGTGCINVSTATEGTSNVQIFDAMGRLVRNVTINGNRSIDVPAGYYIVKIGPSKGQSIIVK
ncbi:MAG: chitobiase/beta-hexosaminidase C-terminal domain-containing protein [Muribaculaceae bacterium]|nr:chitobiase/beta-hexosaminidase C-terminal domain-containing protein [Muribaculaceae bacterium]